MFERDQALAIYMEAHSSDLSGKMGRGVLRNSPNPIACVIDSHATGRDAADVTGSPRHCPIVATVAEARALGAEVLVLGIAPPGGRIPEAWLAALDEAVELGFSLVNGLHDLLGPRYPDLPPGQWVWDVRVEPPGLGIGTGAAAHCAARRVLLVGTDMAIGKMTAGLGLHAAAQARGLRSHFVATGQIGIVISGGGVALDAVRIDFASGAIEREVVAAGDSEIIFVEGQGSLLHPASSATLPLLRGTMPTHLVLCHRAGQTHLAARAQHRDSAARAGDRALPGSCRGLRRVSAAAGAVRVAHHRPRVIGRGGSGRRRRDRTGAWSAVRRPGAPWRGPAPREPAHVVSETSSTTTGRPSPRHARIPPRRP